MEVEAHLAVSLAHERVIFLDLWLHFVLLSVYGSALASTLNLNGDSRDDVVQQHVDVLHSPHGSQSLDYRSGRLLLLLCATVRFTNIQIPRFPSNQVGDPVPSILVQDVTLKNITKRQDFNTHAPLRSPSALSLHYYQ